jgi:branched-chain amino acid transport system ATP-binding protein
MTSGNEHSAENGAAPPALKIDGLEVHYGPLRAVNNVSFVVPAGELVVLLGANGAGKSSLLKAVMGLEPAAAGSIELDGQPLDTLPPHRRVALGLGYAPEGRGVFPTMTVEDNIVAGLGAGGNRSEALDLAYGLFARLKERSKQVAGSLSGGEQQMLSVSRGLACGPKVLLLDELSLGLAPAIVSELFKRIAELRDRGTSILLVEQFAHAALAIANSAGVMVVGELTRFGDAEELRRLSPDQLAAEYFPTKPQAELG